MKGSRKLVLGLAYLAGCFAVGVIISWRAPHELLVAGAYATGVATGLGAVMWGNAQEHRANGGNPK